MPKMNKNISDYKWVMLWAADVCFSLSDIYERESKQSDLIRFYKQMLIFESLLSGVKHQMITPDDHGCYLDSISEQIWPH